MTCLHCGGTCDVTLPILIRDFKKLVNTFPRLHRHCLSSDQTKNVR